MKFGMDPLNDISDKILTHKLHYIDTIIVGDNSSGKSMLLKILVQKAGKTDAVYFIDAVNRGFDVSKVIREERELNYRRTIVDTRILEEYFNLKDSFNCYGTLTERIEQIYDLFEEKLQELFKQLTGEPFRLVKDSILGEVEFGDGYGFLSSGYQAMIRILLELLYYQEKCILEKALDRAMVIIDELDEFLSPSFAYQIFPFLKKMFPQMDFIITTHSCDLVASAYNANLIMLDDAGVEVMDVNDYSSLSEVQILFDRIFNTRSEGVSEIEIHLRRLLNNKINQAWSKRDQQQLELLQKEQLTASQQLICKQIVEW